MGTRGPYADQCNGGIRWGTGPPNAKADHEAKAGIDVRGELSELCCTHSTEHVIKVTNDTMFKERFRQIALQLIEEVHMHLQEILE